MILFVSVPCHKLFIAHYEHVFAEPQAFIEPLADFLELSPDSKQASKPSLLVIDIHSFTILIIIIIIIIITLIIVLFLFSHHICTHTNENPCPSRLRAGAGDPSERQAGPPSASPPAPAHPVQAVPGALQRGGLLPKGMCVKIVVVVAIYYTLYLFYAICIIFIHEHLRCIYIFESYCAIYVYYYIVNECQLLTDTNTGTIQ